MSPKNFYIAIKMPFHWFYNSCFNSFQNITFRRLRNFVTKHVQSLCQYIRNINFNKENVRN